MNTAIKLLADVAKGGSRVAVVPGMHSLDEGLPEGQPPAGVSEALGLLASCMTRDVPAGPAEWVFLVGGPGNGKSHQLVRLLKDLEANGVDVPRLVDGQAARCLPPISRGDSTLLIINDATIRTPAERPANAGHLSGDMRRALEWKPRPSHLLCNVNRGILIEELAEVRDQTDWGPFQRVLEWLVGHRCDSGGERAVRPLPGSSDYFASAELLVGGKVVCRLHSIQLDMLSLLELVPRFEQGGSITGLDGGGQPFAAPYRVMSLDEDKRWDSPLGRILGGTVAEERFEGESCGCCSARDVCPMLANARSLRRGSAGKAFLLLLRGAEIATGRLFTYRDAWCVISHAIVGGIASTRGDHRACDWVKERAGKINRAAGSGQTAASDRRRAVVELELRRLHHVLFPNRLPSPLIVGCQSWRLEPRSTPESVTRLAVVDPALDVTPDWCEPVSDLLEDSGSPAGVAAGLQGELPPGCVSRIDVLFEEELARWLREERVKERERRIHLRWYGTSMYRLYALAKGRVGYHGVLERWVEVHERVSQGQSHALQGDLKKGLRGLLLPQSVDDMPESTLLPLFRPRVEPVRGPQERPVLCAAISREGQDALVLDFVQVGDSLYAVLLTPSSLARRELARIPLDLPTCREAVASALGRGFTDSAVTSIPRVERLRARLVLPQSTGVAHVLVGNTATPVTWNLVE